MFKVIGVIIVIWIVWSLVKAKMKIANSGQNLKIAAETRNIAINELGVPQDYYNKTIQDKIKWKYVRDYANFLRKNGNNSEAVLLKSDIRNINISECSWARLLAFGLVDLYTAEKPYIDVSERLLASIKNKQDSF